MSQGCYVTADKAIVACIYTIPYYPMNHAHATYRSMQSVNKKGVYVHVSVCVVFSMLSVLVSPVSMEKRKIEKEIM